MNEHPHEPAAPAPLAVEAADGYRINGFVWRHRDGGTGGRPVVIINAATSVRCRYYARFAAFLFREGMDVVIYDYRGIGESRPASLRGFDAGWMDWGSLDFEAVLRHADQAFPGQPIQVVGHSVGGVLVGLAASNHLIRRVLTVGAQYAYWPDYAAGLRWRMVAKWHIAMPAITLLFGFFPGKKLGWLEDTPAGVVRDWVSSRRRLEDSLRGHSAARHPAKQEIARRFAAVTAPILAVRITDDEFGTATAVQRLLPYFSNSARAVVEISPASIEEQTIGHFNFFHSKYEIKLWPIPLRWLKFGQKPSYSTSMPAAEVRA